MLFRQLLVLYIQVLLNLAQKKWISGPKLNQKLTHGFKDIRNITFKGPKLGFLMKIVKIWLQISQKRPFLQMIKIYPFWKWCKQSQQTILGIVDQIMSSCALAWNLWETFYWVVQKNRNFGSPVRIFGSSFFRKNWSLKIRNNGSAPNKKVRSCLSIFQFWYGLESRCSALSNTQILVLLNNDIHCFELKTD